ncbi:MAG: T9SS type A sorting domain-containing protein [Saprospiraceae bacterium]|nr:T9SS type A sorting domain-containing protein [Saprospiraceae bacterium]
MTKYISTLGLILVLFAGILPTLSQAQPTLAPSVMQHRNDFPNAVAHLLNEAGFEVQTPSGSQQIQPRFNALQLDSTKTFYGYDLNFPGDSTPLFRTVYTYPEANTKVETNYQWDFTEWLPLNRSTLTYDNLNRLVDVLALAYDPAAGTFIPESKLKTHFHGNSSVLIDSFEVSQWSPDLMDWVVQIATQNVFDSNNRILESYSTLGFLGTPIVFKDVYLYDSNGNNYLIESSGIFEGEETTTGKTENTFFNNQLIASNVFTSDGVDFFPDSRVTFLYAPFGMLARHSTLGWNVEIENWQLVQTTDYNYDEEQRITEKFITFYENGIAADAERPTYEYLEGENLALETIYLYDAMSETWSLDSKKYYYYGVLTNVPHEPTPILALSVAPNPTTGLVKIILEEELAVQLFDATGKLVTAQLLQPGQLLDISSLPAGVYQLVAQNEMNYYGSRIVKL